MAEAAPTATGAERPMASSRRTCLFGGSFDPVHLGHIAMARAALTQCQLDCVVFLPAHLSPFKQEAPPLFTPGQRMELLRLTLSGEKHLELSGLDLHLPPPSWTWRLVGQWQELHPSDSLFWLMGTDQWNQLHRWARFPWLSQNLHFIVDQRGDTAPVHRPGVRVSFIEAKHPASSSGIRRQLRAGLPLPPDWMGHAAEAKAREFIQARPGDFSAPPCRGTPR